MGTDTFRIAAILSLTERSGWDSTNASIAALALHPLDDAPAPGRAFEKAARKVARTFGKVLKRQPEAVASAAAVDALNTYRELAFALDEPYYKTRFDKALGIDSDQGLG